MHTKKLWLIAVLFIVSLFLFVSCSKDANDTSVSNNTFETKITENLSVISSEQNEEKKDISITSLGLAGGEGGGQITVQKYRSVFYDIPSSFISIVGKDVYFEWLETVEYPRVSERMLMVQFVQYFNISREQFDKANLECARSIRDKLDGKPCLYPRDYANQEDDEIYNGDIIYSFDNEVIKDYYLAPDYPYLYDFEFEEAVANGTYTAQTDDWVDIEQMEAEINAKYGAPEVTETTTAIPEETEITE